MSAFVVWALLIASAIQGATPDARDLCSTLAIRWLLAPASDPGASRGGGDPADEVCLAGERPSRRWDGLQQDAHRFTTSAWIRRSAVDAASVGASRLGADGLITPGPGLFEGLCRLNC
jgi:hypothetical protein